MLSSLADMDTLSALFSLRVGAANSHVDDPSLLPCSDWDP